MLIKIFPTLTTLFDPGFVRFSPLRNCLFQCLETDTILRFDPFGPAASRCVHLLGIFASDKLAIGTAILLRDGSFSVFRTSLACCV